VTPEENKATVTAFYDLISTSVNLRRPSADMSDRVTPNTILSSQTGRTHSSTTSSAWRESIPVSVLNSDACSRTVISSFCTATSTGPTMGTGRVSTFFDWITPGRSSSTGTCFSAYRKRRRTRTACSDCVGKKLGGEMSE
jgi:hypothetical protein